MDNKIIISFSTIPTRINDIEPVVKSLVNQSLKPDKIYLNIPKEYKRFNEKLIEPEFLKKEEYKCVEIFYMDKDYGPASKFIGTMLNPAVSENDYIFITDDDVEKKEFWLKTLYDKFIALKQTTICSFVELNLGKEIIWGYMGYVLRKKMINLKDLLDFFDKIEDECFLVDDHWFTGYCRYRSIPIYNIPIKRHLEINIPLPSSDSLVALEGESHRRVVSNKCRKCVMDKFDIEIPFWCCIGCCKRGRKIEEFQPHDINDWVKYKASFVPSGNTISELYDSKVFDNKFIQNEEKIDIKKSISTKETLMVLIFSLLMVKYILSLDKTYNLGIMSGLYSIIYPLLIYLRKFVNNMNDIETEMLIYNERSIYSYMIVSLLILVLIFKFDSIKSNFNSLIGKKPNIENFELEIPKILIQTYHKKESIPSKVFENIKEFASDYKHIIFDNDEIIEFLKKNYRSDVLKTFNLLKGAHKADLFRYCWLYKFGGIYLDIKTELIKPLNEIFNKNYTYSVLSIVRDTIYQGVIATPPGNPIFLKLIKFMIQLVKTGRKYNYIIFTKDFWNNVYRECNMRPFAGINKNIDNPKFSYQLFQEKCTKDKLDCYDGLDRHKLCCYICEGGERIIKSRYADFPW